MTRNEGSEIPFRRRIWLAAANSIFFVVALVWLVPIDRLIEGDEGSWWVRAIIVLSFVAAITAVDWLLRAALLRPVCRNGPQQRFIEPAERRLIA